jgi:hypothetical protein
MRSLKEVIKFVDVLKLKLGCYYKLKTDAPFTWVFEFKGYDGDPTGWDGNLEIISGRTYCVESDVNFDEISGLCLVRSVIKGTITKISLKEFNIISGREIIQ